MKAEDGIEKEDVLKYDRQTDRNITTKGSKRGKKTKTNKRKKERKEGRGRIEKDDNQRNSDKNK